MEKSKIIYFFKKEDYLSQWFESSFLINEINFSSAEQWMMYSKALLFSDYKSMELILNEKSPGKQKDYGRNVKGFKKEIWDKKKENIVYNGNYAKFNQNEKLKKKLLNTRFKLLAEANPNDLIWGIGLSEFEAKKRYKTEWRGSNLLGIILMKVRDNLE